MPHGCDGIWGGNGPNLANVLANLSTGTGWGEDLATKAMYNAVVGLRKALEIALGFPVQQNVPFVGGTINDPSIQPDATAIAAALTSHRQSTVHDAPPIPHAAPGWLTRGDSELPAVNLALALMVQVKDCLDAPAGGGGGKKKRKKKSKKARKKKSS